jgi:hypothetical protein
MPGLVPTVTREITLTNWEVEGALLIPYSVHINLGWSYCYQPCRETEGWIPEIK